MEDEPSVLLESKTLLNLRVVDLKQELEKRGLPKSGSKKDLVKRLKQQLEFEKLCGERKQTGDCDLKLELDADTEQNEFVQQYLAQQQKIIAEQKEVKRLIELEELQKSSDEKEGFHSLNKAADEETEPEEESSEDEEDVKEAKTEDYQENDVTSSQIGEEHSESSHFCVVSAGCSSSKDYPNNCEVSPEIVRNAVVESSGIAVSVLRTNTLDMEPATQVSSVPYSLSDIQLPDSPGNRMKPVSKTISNDIGSESSIEGSTNCRKFDVKSNGVEYTEATNSICEKSSVKRKSDDEAMDIDIHAGQDRKSFKADSSSLSDNQEIDAIESSETVVFSEEKSTKTEKCKNDGYSVSEDEKRIKGVKKESETQSEGSEIKGSDSETDENRTKLKKVGHRDGQKIKNRSKYTEGSKSRSRERSPVATATLKQKSRRGSEDRESSKHKEHSRKKTSTIKSFRSRSRSSEGKENSKCRDRSPRKSKRKSVRSRSRSRSKSRSRECTPQRSTEHKSVRSHEDERSSKSRSREHSHKKTSKHKSVRSQGRSRESEIRSKSRSRERSPKKTGKHKSVRSRSRSSDDINDSKSRTIQHSPKKTSTHKSRATSQTSSSEDGRISRSKSRERSPKKVSETSRRSSGDKGKFTDMSGEHSPTKSCEKEFVSINLDKSPEKIVSSICQSRESSPTNSSKSKTLSSEEICGNDSGGNSPEHKKADAITGSLIIEMRPDTFESKRSEPDIKDPDLALKENTIEPCIKEFVKQKLKIKRNSYKNVEILEKSDKGLESKIDERCKSTLGPLLSESSSEERAKPLEAQTTTATKYVSRKISLSNRKLSENFSDEPKRSKWGNFAVFQKSYQNINISTDSLKNWFPDFKLLNDPAPVTDVIPVEVSSPVKEEINLGFSPIDKLDEDPKLPVSVLDGNKEEAENEADLEKTLDDGPASKILFVRNLVRPFTLHQLKELLKETGNVVDDEFWIDKIKSKCFVTYETEDEAVKTRNALNGTRWPSSNPKILSVEFAKEEELMNHRSGCDLSKPAPHHPPPESLGEAAVHPSGDYRKADLEQIRKKERSRPQQHVREWDKDKITQESPEREHTARSMERIKGVDKREKKDAKKRPNEDTPAKLLDDLFQKTKSSPCIYWLPLTDERVLEREESRRLRRLNTEKRNQQREQENAEHSQKRTRSRNRTRETETRRSTTRSRSPISRRR